VGYNDYEENEWKAWWEFVDKTGIEFEWIGGNISKFIKASNDVKQLFDSDRAPTENISPSHENVALRILRNPCLKH
jgi:hypothetical protein